MAQADTKSFQIGDLRVTVFDFKEIGDFWPIHIHTEESMNNHISIVKGRILCHGHPEFEGKILENGQLVDWPVNKDHGFEALEPNSRLVNIVKQVIGMDNTPISYG